jgi:hypothetical protein
MKMRKQVREKTQKDWGPTFTNRQLSPRPFAFPGPEHESLSRKERFGHNLSDLDYSLKAKIQPKLIVSPPDDKYEREADRVAEQVMQMKESCPHCQDESEDEHTFREKLNANQIMHLKRDGMGGATQRNQEGAQTSQVSPSLENEIRSLRGSGQPLPESVRAFFEPRFGHDFSQLRLHTDAKAKRLTSAMNARAFTTGRDIVFGARQYDLRSDTGRRLMAHELTHVVQQGGFNESFEYMHKLQLEVDETPHNDSFCPEHEASNAGSAHFNLAEFRCRDGTDVPERFRGNVQQLMDNLEILRSELGDNSIRVNSGYRTPAYNQSINGSRQSRHMCGQAADIRVNSYIPIQVADTIESLIGQSRMVQGGLGRYPSFIHYDVRGTRARW